MGEGRGAGNERMVRCMTMGRDMVRRISGGRAPPRSGVLTAPVRVTLGRDGQNEGLAGVEASELRGCVAARGKAHLRAAAGARGVRRSHAAGVPHVIGAQAESHLRQGRSRPGAGRRRKEVGGIADVGGRLRQRVVGIVHQDGRVPPNVHHRSVRGPRECGGRVAHW